MSASIMTFYLSIWTPARPTDCCWLDALVQKPDSIQILQVFKASSESFCFYAALNAYFPVYYILFFLLVSAGYQTPLQFTVLLLHSLLMKVNNLLAKTGNKRQKCFFFLTAKHTLQDSESSNASFCPLLLFTRRQSSHTSHGDENT